MKHTVKKVLIIAMIALALSSAAVFACAASNSRSKIADINYDRWDNGQLVAEDAAYSVSSGRGISALTGMRLSPGAEVRIYLDADMFLDEDGTPFGDRDEGVTKADLRNGKVTLSTKKLQTPSMIEEISLEYDSSRKTSYIKIELIEPFTGTGRRTVAGTIRLKIAGTAYDETEFRFEGQLTNTEIAIDPDTDYVDLSGNVYGNPSSFIRDVTVDLGEGVTITTHMYANKKYYGRATAKDGVPADNAEVLLVYEISQQNLATGSTLHFQLDEMYYVYDGQGAYLGTTNDDLAVLGAYCLTKEYVDELALKEKITSQRSGGGRSGGGSALEDPFAELVKGTAGTEGESTSNSTVEPPVQAESDSAESGHTEAAGSQKAFHSAEKTEDVPSLDLSFLEQ